MSLGPKENYTFCDQNFSQLEIKFFQGYKNNSIDDDDDDDDDNNNNNNNNNNNEFLNYNYRGLPLIHLKFYDN